MKILFQGDSVTDAGRDRSNPHDMGEGYAKYASAMLEDSFPDVEFEFLNLGVSGDRTENLVARLENDFVEIQPDIISIMIGVNDVWHRFLCGIETTDSQFEENYRTILQAIKEKTNAKIFMIAPFTIDDCYSDKAELREELDRKIAIVERLAGQYADAYLNIDAVLSALDADGDKMTYSQDGVHPSAEGACFIGQKYLEAVSALVGALAEKE